MDETPTTTTTTILMIMHKFTKKRHKSPHWCVKCNKIIRVIGKKCFSCEVCGINCHGRCVGFVPPNCTRIFQTSEERSGGKSVGGGGGKLGGGEGSINNIGLDSLYFPLTLIEKKKNWRVEKGRKKGETTLEFNEYFIKTVEKDKIFPEEMDHIEKTTKMIRSLKHKNIIDIKETFELNNNFHIVYNYYQQEGDSLFDRIIKKKERKYSEGHAKLIIRSLLHAISFLHSNNIVFVDLSLENIFLKSNLDPLLLDHLLDHPFDLDLDGDLFLSSFDLAFKLVEKKEGEEEVDGDGDGNGNGNGDHYLNHQKRVQKVQPIYLSPEVIRGSEFSKESDMWMIGVISYILLSGCYPFYDTNVNSLFDAIKLIDFFYPEEHWKNISDLAINFIEKLFTKKESDRLTADAALSDPWLIDHQNNIINNFNINNLQDLRCSRSRTSTGNFSSFLISDDIDHFDDSDDDDDDNDNEFCFIDNQSH